MRAKKFISLLALLLVAAMPLMAQKLTATVSKSKMAVGENFQLTFTLNTGGSGFKAPALGDFVVYMGPNQSTSMQIINGNVSQSVSYSYLLSPKKEGKLTIGPASIMVGGSRIESNSVTVEVKGTYNPGQQQQSNPYAGRPQQQQQPEEATASAGDNLFVRTVVSKKKAYLGEQITVSHKVYTRMNLKGFKDIKFPAYNGFWAQDMPQQQNITATTENIDGVAYQVAELKKTFLFAQRTGKIDLAPIEVECIVRQRSSSGSNDFWSDPWWPFESYKDVVYSVKSKPVSIEIMPLPEEGKPAGFSGAVGDYSFKASVDRERTKANEAITLNLTITGQGNIKLIEPLKLEFPEEIETYSPKIDDNISLSASGVSGSKSFDYLLIPRQPGTYKLGGASFSYFDPAKQAYITLPSPEFNITVDKGDNSSAQVMNPHPSKEDVKVLGNDIRYIKTGAILLTEKEKHFFGSPVFIAGMTAPVAGFFLFLFLRRRHIDRNSDIVQVKSRKATRMAQKRLSIAQKHIQGNNKELFYEEIFRALYGYLSDKLNIPAADLSKDRIAAALQQRNADPGTIGRLLTLLDTCEYARYAPSAVTGDLNKVYTDSVELITTLEGEIK